MSQTLSPGLQTFGSMAGGMGATPTAGQQPSTSQPSPQPSAGPFTAEPFGGMDHHSFLSSVGQQLGVPADDHSIQPGFDGVDMGTAGQIGMGIAGMVPGPVGIAASIGNLGLHGYNLGETNGALNESGLPSLGFGQTLGSLLGLNSYANGSNQGLQNAIAAQGGNTQSAGSPGFSVGAASGAGQASGLNSGGGFSSGAASGEDSGAY